MVLEDRMGGGEVSGIKVSYTARYDFSKKMYTFRYMSFFVFFIGSRIYKACHLTRYIFNFCYPREFS